MDTNNTAFPPDLPDKLKKLRQSQGWLQGQLGQRLGINVQLVSKYEKPGFPGKTGRD